MTTTPPNNTHWNKVQWLAKIDIEVSDDIQHFTRTGVLIAQDLVLTIAEYLLDTDEFEYREGNISFLDSVHVYLYDDIEYTVDEIYFQKPWSYIDERDNENFRPPRLAILKIKQKENETIPVISLHKNPITPDYAKTYTPEDHPEFEQRLDGQVINFRDHHTWGNTPYDEIYAIDATTLPYSHRFPDKEFPDLPSQRYGNNYHEIVATTSIHWISGGSPLIIDGLVYGLVYKSSYWGNGADNGEVGFVDVGAFYPWIESVMSGRIDHETTDILTLPQSSPYRNITGTWSYVSAAIISLIVSGISSYIIRQIIGKGWDIASFLLIFPLLIIATHYGEFNLGDVWIYFGQLIVTVPILLLILKDYKHLWKFKMNVAKSILTIGVIISLCLSFVYPYMESKNGAEKYELLKFHICKSPENSREYCDMTDNCQTIPRTKTCNINNLCFLRNDVECQVTNTMFGVTIFSIIALCGYLISLRNLRNLKNLTISNNTLTLQNIGLITIITIILSVSFAYESFLIYNSENLKEEKAWYIQLGCAITCICILLETLISDYRTNKKRKLTTLIQIPFPTVKELPRIPSL